MNILLIGYGKMGKTIEQLAISQGHTIIGFVDKDHPFSTNLLTSADVAIEFTQPEAAYQNILTCLEHNLPVVSGTTGWLSRKPELDAACLALNATYLQASNFSVGVHLFLHVVKQATALLAPYSAYNPTISETHHTAKLDMPSGTALLTQQAMAEANAAYHNWYLTNDLIIDDRPNGILPITSIREEDVPGTHTLTFDSTIDSIQISHIAHSRIGFAAGAITAASWIVGKKGVFTMGDVLGLT